MESVSRTGSSTNDVAQEEATRHRADGGGVRWTILPGWRDDVLGVHAPRWSDLENDDRATLVKSNANRTVWRIELAGRSLFVKRSRVRTVGGRVRKLLRVSPGRREWRSAGLAKARNVPTVEYVAFGRTACDEFVVTEALAEARTLDEAWSAAINLPNAAERKRDVDALIAGVARLLAQAHRGGFFHGDDHPGNVLVPFLEGSFDFSAGAALGCHGQSQRGHAINTERHARAFGLGMAPRYRRTLFETALVSIANDEVCSAVYLDMQRSRATRRAGDRDVVHSIAQLHQWFQTRASRSQRWRFLQAYCLDRCDGDKHEAVAMARQLLPRIMDESAEQSLALWAKRDRRILSPTNRYFARMRLGDGARGVVTLRFRRRDLVPPPGVPDRSVDEWRRSLAGARLDGDAPEGTSPGPIFSSFRLGDRLSWRFTGSPARRRFVTGHRLRHRDLPCRWPVALIERRSFSARRVARVWWAECPTTVSLAEACDDPSKRALSRHSVLRSLARTLLKMSRRGSYIKTMSDDTFGVATESGDVIIDNPTCVQLAHLAPHPHLVTTLQALYRFAAERGAFRRTDGARLLRALSPGDWKSMWRSLADVNTSSSRCDGETN